MHSFIIYITLSLSMGWQWHTHKPNIQYLFL